MSDLYPHAKNSLTVIKGYKLNTASPLDIRTVVDKFDDSTKQQIPGYNVYEGIVVYDQTNKQLYVCSSIPTGLTPDEYTAYDCTWKKVPLTEEEQPDLDELNEKVRRLRYEMDHIIIHDNESNDVMISWEDIEV